MNFVQDRLSSRVNSADLAWFGCRRSLTSGVGKMPGSLRSSSFTRAIAAAAYEIAAWIVTYDLAANHERLQMALDALRAADPGRYEWEVDA